MSILLPYARVVLKPGKDRSVRRRHPLVFSGAVDAADAGIADGDVVSVLGRDGGCLGVGHYQSGGSIRVRMLDFEARLVDAAFWSARLGDAFALRSQLGLAGSAVTNAYRLVHGEGDGLPGLIADVYDTHVVLQPHSAGMVRAVPAIRSALAALPLPPGGFAVHTAGAAADASDGVPGCRIRENGLAFDVDWRGGQKTGFYLDQRENRALMEAYAREREVLNLFSYSGAFSVYALRGGARFVRSVDASAQALEGAARHVELNGLASDRHETVRADAFDFLKNDDRRYELVVLDPPAFAKHMSARHQAIQAYRRLNAAALQRLAPGGFLFTFSCSQVVTPDLFRGAVLAAAIDAGRPVRILHQLHQPPDHPVSLYHPEGEYLKGLALRV
jgi:23S rRNA (cytosine1962-C5)-methyltransferase